MKIEEITIRNFKGYRQETTFSLHPDVALVIGNNAQGKSSFIYAIQVALGAFLQSLHGIPSQALYRRQIKESEEYRFFDYAKKDYVSQHERPRICAKAMLHDGIRISWWRELTKGGTTTHNRICAGEMMKYAEWLEDNWDNNEHVVMPVLLSFGTSRLNAQVRKGRERKSRLNRLEKSYLASLSDKVDYEGSVEWLHNYDKNVRDGKEFNDTREALFNALTTAIPYLSEIQFNKYYNQLEAVVTIDGVSERLLLEDMSDGLKAMVNVVCETAYRCIELNGRFGADAITRSTGVVMIDEIDMHLHPKWQRTVIRDLKRAFPNIQFILTSHSPFVVQSVKKENVISLDNNAWEGDPDMMALEEIAERPMNMPEQQRSKRFGDMLKAAEDYHKALANGNPDGIDAARNAFRTLELAYSDDPAYVAMMKEKLELL